LNVRFSLGRFRLWFMNPQYHRIHHSVQPEHINKNFADLFPFWDVLFGTVVAPGEDEFPQTGLFEDQKPESLFEGLVWPIRSFIKAKVSATKQSAGKVGNALGLGPYWPR
jgi:sterol desaturase/sphingolipid hydroxylase (fatty acid hydroxylase superfamily)